MAKKGGGGLAEYVIRLSTELDNAGVSQILSYLDTTKLKALGLTAALTGLTTAIYKFAEATAKKEFELQKLAKAEGKTTAAINARETALKSMGKTIKEIEKDASLRKVYEDIRKFNSELELPNVDRAMEKVTNLRNAFWKMKSALNYAIQGIGRQFLINMEQPIERITGGLDNISLWVKNNLNSISSKVSLVLTDFSKGIIGIGEGVGQIFNLFNQLPDAIKGVGLAVAAIVGVANSGPLGKILALIGLVGDIYHDYDNYLWNQQNAETREFLDENGEPIKVPVEFEDEWGILSDSNITGRDKSTLITDRLIKRFSGALEGFVNALNKPGATNLREWVSKLTGPLGDILGGILDWAKSNEGRKQISDMAGDLLLSITTALSTVGEMGVDITSSVGQMLYGIFEGGNVNWEEAWKQSGISKFLQSDNSFAVGLHTALGTALVGGDLLTSVVTGALSGFQNSRKEAIWNLWKEDMAATNGYIMERAKYEGGLDEEGNVLYTWLEQIYKGDKRLDGLVNADLIDDFSKTFDFILETAASGIKIAGSTATFVVKQLVQGIANGLKDSNAKDTVTQALDALGESNGILDSITLGIGTWMASGNFFAGLAAGISDGIAVYTANPEAFEKDVAALKEAIITLWEGAWEDDGQGGQRRNGVGLKSLFEGLFGDVASIANSISTKLEPIKKAILGWLNDLWISFYNSNPLVQFAFGDPNKSTVTPNGDGTYTVTSSNNQSLTTGQISEEAGAWLMEHGDILSVNNGRLVGTGAVGDAHWNDALGGAGTYYGFNTYINDLITRKDGRVNLAVGTWEDVIPVLNAILEQQGYKNEPQEDKGNTGDASHDKLGDNSNKTAREVGQMGSVTKVTNAVLQKFYEMIDLGGQKAERFGDELKSVWMGFDDETVKIAESAGGASSGLDAVTGAANSAAGALASIVVPGAEAAWGGRIGHEMRNVTVGEDGTEYIIPITKPERAAMLIQQMFNEMGSASVQKIMSGLGIGEPGTVGASMASLKASISGASTSNNFNINAPISINVNATGADAKEIGSSIYDIAERHLIKDVMGVYA